MRAGCVLAGRVRDAFSQPHQSELSDRDLVTVTVLVGYYTTVALLTGTLEVELDDAPDPFTAEH